VTDVAHLSEGRASIGATPTIGVYLVPQWLQDFRQENKQLTMSLSTAITDQIIKDVKSLKLELAFVEGEIETDAHADIATLKLDAIDWYVIVAPNHPWWNQSDVSLEQLHQCGFVMRQRGSHTRAWVDKFFAQYNITPRITAEFDNPESIKQALYTGDNVTLLPRYTVQREIEAGQLRYLPIRDVPLQRDLKLVWNSKRPFTPISYAFMRFIQVHYPVIQKIVLK
jgi:DNA-binding transcriptional LysR family regulator